MPTRTTTTKQSLEPVELRSRLKIGFLPKKRSCLPLAYLCPSWQEKMSPFLYLILNPKKNSNFLSLLLFFLLNILPIGVTVAALS
jgi:hypothetical protein